MRNNAIVLKALVDEVCSLWWWHKLIPTQRFLRMTDAMMRQAIIVKRDMEAPEGDKVLADIALAMHDRLIRPIWYS